MKAKDYLESFTLTEQQRLHYETKSHWNEVTTEYIDTYTNEDADIMYDLYRASDEEHELLQQAIAYLTDKQRRILDLHLNGMSQTDIANALEIHQTSVHKTLYGNEVKYKGVLITHGGIVNKIKRVVKKIKEQRWKKRE